MNNLITNPFIIVILASSGFLIIAFLYFFSRKSEHQTSYADKFEELYKKINEDIKYAVSPKFMELSLGVNELVDLAVEVWRMEQRITKSASSLPKNQLKGLKNSIQKLRRYLEKYDIEIVDYKNQKFNEGLNLDILSVERDLSLSQPMVKEIVEPTIMCKGQIVRKAKIILLTNKQ